MRHTRNAVRGLALLLLFSCARAEPRKPNVLLITLDTFRADRVGSATPNLQKLVASGVRFDQAQSPVPLTLPAHASILSGLLPLHHGVHTNAAGSFPADRETLATLFSRSGYRSGAFVGAFVLDHRFGLNRGFDVYDDEVERGTAGDVSLEASRRADAVVDRALAWLRTSDARPYFSWVHLWDAHAPYAPPAPHPQTYDGEVTYVDAQLGRLLAAVDRTNTIIVIAGDHGEALGEHGEATHGLLLYQPTLHVPMIIAAPEVESRVVSQPVSSIDLAPTIASLAGLEFPGSDGRDLTATLRSGSAPTATTLYAETQYPLIFGWSELFAARSENMKLISGPASELFDLARDPHETTNARETQRRITLKLDAYLSGARKTAVAAADATVDDETKRKLASLGYVAPAPVAAASARPDPKAMAPLFVAFERALADIASGRARNALAPLQQLVARDPANPVFRATLARVQRQFGRAGEAVTLYRESVALAPNDADAWYNLGVALSETGNRREAIVALGEAVRRDPNRAEAHNALGRARIEEGDAAAAALDFQRAVAADPRNARAWNNVGNAMRAQGRADEAASAYRKASELAPGYADPLNGLGVLLVQQQRPREAVSYFSSAIRLQPDFYEAKLNRGIALQEAGDSAAAIAQYRELLDTPQRDAARTLLGNLGVR